MDKVYDQTIDFFTRCNPNVKEYIDSQAFIKESETVDAIDENFILSRCYQIVINDLKDIGIEMYNHEDIMTNNYDAKVFAWLYDVLSPDKLIQLIDENDNINTFIIDGSSIFSDNEIIVQLLKLLSISYPDNDEMLNNYILLHDKIFSTELFNTYLSNVYKLYKTFFIKSTPIDEINSSQLNAFFEFYKTSIENIDLYLNKIPNIKPYIADKVKKAIKSNFFKFIFNNESELSIFSTFYLLKKKKMLNSIGNKTIDIFKKHYIKYLKQSKFHPFYYINSNYQITIDKIIAMAIVTCIETNISPFTFEELVNKTAMNLASINEEFASLYTTYIKAIKSLLFIGGN